MCCFCQAHLLPSHKCQAIRPRNLQSGLIDLGKAYLGQGKYDEALKNVLCSLDIRKNNIDQEHPSWFELDKNIGKASYQKGMLNQAPEHYKKCLRVALQIYGGQSKYATTCYNNIGSVFQKKGLYEKAIENYEPSLKMYIFREKDQELSSIYNNLGSIYTELKALDYLFEKSRNQEKM